jgi:hypothetical protein
MFYEQEEWQFREWFYQFLRDQYQPEPHARQKDGVFVADFTNEWPKFASALTLIAGLASVWLLFLISASVLRLLSEPSLNFWSIASLLMPLYLLFLSLSVFIPHLRFILGQRSIEQAELFLQHVPQRLGQELRISYKLQSRVKIHKVLARIRCFEQVRQERARFVWFGIPRIKELEHELWRQDLPTQAHAIIDDQHATLTWQISLPSDLPPSFRGTHNALHWRIELEPQLAGLATVSHQYTLQVLPEVLR